MYNQEVIHMVDNAALKRVRMAFAAEELHYDFGPEHPLNPDRLRAMFDLLECTGLWNRTDERTRLDIRPASIEELSLVHTPDYIAAVQRLGDSYGKQVSAQERRELSRLEVQYGFEDGDTPTQEKMHEISSLIVGGTLVALSAVMGLPEGGSFASEDNRPLHVFHPAGGLHHAWAERASGFCIYNDAAIAIAHVIRSSEAKVLYIDFDAHHGDGVQRAFYDDPRVLTISFHETGRYLFPGSGDVLELGEGNGHGYSVNIPLEPFTEDDSYIEAMEALFEPVITAFAPTVLITQHGCDTHAWDPLTHLYLTTRGIQAQMKMAHWLAHTFCRGRWVALGGGGYSLYRVVPRAWSLLWAEMSEQEVPERLPEEWVQRWKPAWETTIEYEEEAEQVLGKLSLPKNFPTTFMDLASEFPPQPRRAIISRTNRQKVSLVRHLMVPLLVRYVFSTVRRRSPLAGLFDLLHMSKESAPSRTREYVTPKGPVLLRDFCPPSLVERLRADEGLYAFARVPEREHQLLLDIAKSPDCALVLAHTPDGAIIGEVTIAPADEWWEGIDNLYEVAIEVSAGWHGMGIARQLADFALELNALEDMILFAIGLSRHWDIEGVGISVYHYRDLIVKLFAHLGFKEYPTTEPNVSMEPANVLVARIGERVDPRVANQFLSRLLRSSNITYL
jgi:acetoin utilization deacetylase AcuC-like enzyme/GNAT superfamily N-acetyltransferase